MRWLPISLAILGVLAGAQVRAEADEVAAPAEPSGPPDVIVLTEQVGPGFTRYDLRTIAPDGTRTPILEEMPSGTFSLAVHAATGRWLLTFGQLSNGDPLVIDGEPVSKPRDRNTLVFGERGAIVATTLGDPGCTNAEKACFEPTHGFSEDGQYVFVETLASSYSLWHRWTFGATPARALIADKAVAPSLVRDRDGGRAVYLRKDAVHVTTFPKQPASPKSKAVKIKATSKPALAPKLLMSAVTPIGDALYYFRREPQEQKRGWVERYDLTTKQATPIFEAPEEFPMWGSPFLSTGARGTVLFTHDAQFERGDLYEVDVEDTTPARVAQDVRTLLDVSADGRYVLFSRYVDPARGQTVTNPERLVIFDLIERREVAELDAGGDGIEIEAARFIARPTTSTP